MHRRYVNTLYKSMGKLSILVISMFLCAADSSLNKDKVILAINCGSKSPYQSTISGVTFIPDAYYDAGVESNAGGESINSWTRFNDITLYYTERYGKDETFVYKLPLPTTNRDGHYVLILKFSEVYFSSSGQKLFNVSIGDTVVISDLDIYNETDKFGPLDKFIEFDVKGETINYLEKSINSAITPKGELIVQFIKGKADNPKVNAIILVKGMLADTDYDEYQRYYKTRREFMKAKTLYTIDDSGMSMSKDMTEDWFQDAEILPEQSNKGNDGQIMEGIKTFLPACWGLQGIMVAFIIVFFIIFSIVSSLSNR